MINPSFIREVDNLSLPGYRDDCYEEFDCRGRWIEEVQRPSYLINPVFCLLVSIFTQTEYFALPYIVGGALAIVSIAILILVARKKNMKWYNAFLSPTIYAFVATGMLGILVFTHVISVQPYVFGIVGFIAILVCIAVGSIVENSKRRLKNRNRTRWLSTICASGTINIIAGTIAGLITVLVLHGQFIYLIPIQCAVAFVFHAFNFMRFKRRGEKQHISYLLIPGVFTNILMNLSCLIMLPFLLKSLISIHVLMGILTGVLFISYVARLVIKSYVCKNDTVSNLSDINDHSSTRELRSSENIGKNTTKYRLFLNMGRGRKSKKMLNGLKDESEQPFYSDSGNINAWLDSSIALIDADADVETLCLCNVKNHTTSATSEKANDIALRNSDLSSHVVKPDECYNQLHPPSLDRLSQEIVSEEEHISKKHLSSYCANECCHRYLYPHNHFQSTNCTTTEHHSFSQPTIDTKELKGIINQHGILPEISEQQKLISEDNLNLNLTSQKLKSEATCSNYPSNSRDNISGKQTLRELLEAGGLSINSETSEQSSETNTSNCDSDSFINLVKKIAYNRQHGKNLACFLVEKQEQKAPPSNLNRKHTWKWRWIGKMSI